MHNAHITSERDYDLGNQIVTKRIYKVKSTVLSEWHKLFVQVHVERTKVSWNQLKYRSNPLYIKIRQNC